MCFVPLRINAAKMEDDRSSLIRNHSAVSSVLGQQQQEQQQQQQPCSSSSKSDDISLDDNSSTTSGIGSIDSKSTRSSVSVKKRNGKMGVGGRGGASENDGTMVKREFVPPDGGVRVRGITIFLLNAHSDFCLTVQSIIQVISFQPFSMHLTITFAQGLDGDGGQLPVQRHHLRHHQHLLCHLPAVKGEVR